MPERPKLLFSRFHPSAFLLAAQLLFLILYAVFDGQGSERAWISTFGILVLVLRIWVVKQSPGINWIAWLLAAPALILELFNAISFNSSVSVISSLLEAALYFYTAGSLIAYMMEDYEVTTDELYAVGATFTLLAWGFAYLALVCQALLPGSFINTVSGDQSMSFIELLFLSFTNLSATGLSDIVPVTTPARIILMLEQFSGVGYVAMVVSRLVGLMSQRRANRHGR